MTISEILERYRKYGPFWVNNDLKICEYSCDTWQIDNKYTGTFCIPDDIALAYIESATMAEMGKDCMVKVENIFSGAKIMVINATRMGGKGSSSTLEEHQNRLELWEWFKGMEE